MDNLETERTEELRLALVLNGGVSLAVWMGGVAFELNRLVRESHPVYRGLLELTRTAARIDVISGTSAGGINGAALALAQIHDASLYSLRDVWLQTAGLDQLMRRPEDPDPTSLLRGDDWFLPNIRNAFAALADGPAAPASSVPVLLSLTTTLLDGMGHKQLDDFGAVVEDTVHRAQWRFERLDDQADAFTDSRIVDQLAFAARSTASFPVAFEPASFDPAGEVFKGTQALNARVGRLRSVQDRRFLLDGGILDNKPFEAALEGIARLPAQGQTRRVLAYIVPDPAAAAAARPLDAQQQPVPPTLAEAAWRSLVSIPGAQSIAGHMAELREHNDSTLQRWRRLFGALRHAGGTPLLAAAPAMLPAYRARRVDGIVDYLIGEIETRLAQGAVGSDGTTVGMRRATRQWLASTWRASSERAPLLWQADPLNATERRAHRLLARLWAARVPSRWDPAQPLFGPGRWNWGLYTLEFVADLTIELLRRTQRLNALVERWNQGDGAVVSAAPPPRVALRPGQDWKDLDLLPSPARAGLRRGAQRVGDAVLQPIWQRAYDLAARIRQRRRQANQQAGEIGAQLFVDLIAEWRQRGGEKPARALALKMIQALLANRPEDQQANDDDALALFRQLAELEAPMRAILQAQAQRQRASGRADIEEAVLELSALHGFLFGGAPALDALAWRVLALEVFEVSAASRRAGPNAQPEVVQISGRLASALGGSDNPSLKLNGMQLAHFGAFYKRSWRANDWTFGCLDGIDRAVRIALNPDALQRRFGNRRVDSGNGPPVSAAAYVKATLRVLAVDSAEDALREFLATQWQHDDEAITTELAWLDESSSVPPPVLVCCAAALTRRLQLETLRRELPEIARSLLAERDQGAPPVGSASARLLACVAPNGQPRTPSAEDAAALVKDNLLGSESLPQQIGTDLFTRTTTQALATGHAALSSRHGGLNALNVLFKLTEWPLLLLYWLGNRLAQAGNTGVALEGAALGTGLALVAANLLGQQLPGWTLGMGWALLLGVLGATLLRSRVLGALLFIGLLALLVWIDPALLWPCLGVAGVVLLLLWRHGGTPAMLIIVLAAAWWSGHGSMAALGPALLLVALVLLNAFSRWLGARGDRLLGWWRGRKR